MVTVFSEEKLDCLVFILNKFCFCEIQTVYKKYLTSFAQFKINDKLLVYIGTPVLAGLGHEKPRTCCLYNQSIFSESSIKLPLHRLFTELSLSSSEMLIAIPNIELLSVCCN